MQIQFTNDLIGLGNRMDHHCNNFVQLPQFAISMIPAVRFQLHIKPIIGFHPIIRV